MGNLFLSRTLKFLICIVVDIFDFTIGRFLFFVRVFDEPIGCAIEYASFGKVGLLYLLETFDPTEQIDGFFLLRRSSL